MSAFAAVLYSPVRDRRPAPDDFLEDLLHFGRTASAEIFARRPGTDIYSFVRPQLGPAAGLDWLDLLDRRAAMLEVLRVLAAFESSYNWMEGKDSSNPKEDTQAEYSAGIFQISADSIGFGSDLKVLVARVVGTRDARAFQRVMKTNHAFALEYAARLLRHTTDHNGPVRDRLINRWLNLGAKNEFRRLLAA